MLLYYTVMKHKSTLVITILLFLCLVYPSRSEDNSLEKHDHELYTSGCCNAKDNGGDCHPINSCDELEELPNGEYKWKHYTFNRLGVHPSKNSKCHVCIGNEGKAKEYEQPR